MTPVLASLLTLAAILILSYLLGSFPSAIVIGKVFYGVDVRAAGSHNAGGTNVGRVIGKKAGFITIAADVGKTILALWIPFLIISLTPLASQLLPAENFPREIYYYLGSIGAAIGHSFPVFAHFKGGKSMSVYAGFVLGSNIVLAAVGIAIFLAIYYGKKYVSLASVTAPFIVALLSLFIAFFPVLNCTAYFFIPDLQMIESSYIYSAFLFVIALYVVFRHIPNIRRLINHTEPQTHFKKTPPIAESVSGDHSDK